jgi:hypothetical protein
MDAKDKPIAPRASLVGAVLLNPRAWALAATGTALYFIMQVTALSTALPTALSAASLASGAGGRAAGCAVFHHSGV